MARISSATEEEFGTEYGRLKMFEETLKKILKPTIKEVYAEGYNAGQEDTSRRMHEMYTYGFMNGYCEAKAEVGEIELEDVEQYVGKAVE